MTDSNREYGLYTWWPPSIRPRDWVTDPFENQIHPDDVKAATALGPAGPLQLVFERVGGEGEYLIIANGDTRLRVQPDCWRPVNGDGLHIGDRVEVVSQDGRNTPRIGTIRAMVWHQKDGRIKYYLQEGHRKLSKRYTAEDLKLIEAETA